MKKIIADLKRELRIIGEVKNDLCLENDARYPVLKHSLCQCFILLDYLEEKDKKTSNDYKDKGEKGNEEIIKRYLEQMVTQNNRSTAFPIYFVIRSSKEVYIPLDMADSFRYYDPDDCERDYESKEEAIKSLKKDGYEPEEIKEIVGRIEKVGTNREWVENGMFLTESDAKAHLERNSYHYSKDAHTYVKHAWRAPELKQFLISLLEYFGVERDIGKD